MKKTIFSRVLGRGKKSSINLPQWLKILREFYQNPSLPISYLTENMPNDYLTRMSFLIFSNLLTMRSPMKKLLSFKLENSGIQKDMIIQKSIQVCRLGNGNINFTIDHKQTTPGQEIYEMIELTQEEAEYFLAVLSSLLTYNGQASPAGNRKEMM